ncbi:MAG: acyl carrier protein [Gemmatimonadota bacterium]|nr:MAG: acyl carrier protein [Gemmatimonadota bacterium]
MAPEQIIGRIFGVNPGKIDDTTSNTTLEEWDSMGHVNLIMELESTYGVSLSPDDALQMTNVATIKRILQSRGASW